MGRLEYGSSRMEWWKNVGTEATWFSTLILFGHMVKTMGFVPVEFNDSGEVGLDGMWSMVKPRSAQVSNSAMFGRMLPVQLLTGANMSGKTFHLKSLIFSLACAHATGFAPAKKATIPLFDSISYLDRVTEKSDRNLSAFGNEIKNWISLFGLPEEHNTIMVTDEAFSTTSPKYQSALTYAIVVDAICRGSFIALSSHNHDSLTALGRMYPDLANISHFKVHTEGDTIKFDHLKVPGDAPSNAIAVAKALGLSPEIIDLALGG
jgi:DNA mismatch repair protein MutS